MDILLQVWDIANCVNCNHNELADFLLVLAQERNIYEVEVSKSKYSGWFVSKL